MRLDLPDGVLSGCFDAPAVLERSERLYVRFTMSSDDNLVLLDFETRILLKLRNQRNDIRKEA